jgi:hypothetical protein
VVGFALAATLVLAGLMIVPALVGFLPKGVRGHPVESWSVVVLFAFSLGRTFASRAGDEKAVARVRRFLDRLDDGSGWALDRGVLLGVAILIAGMLASWAPHYLTWPWFRDADSYATMAQSWDAGIRPYRDIRAFNFPGHIYLHWLIGRTFGWGKTVAYYAFDVVALLTLGLALRAWSRRRLGGQLPGLIGYLAFLGFYLSLDYVSAAQRDWHATLVAALAILALEAWPGRAAIYVAALLEAIAILIRPHAVLFLPAIFSAIAERPRPGRTACEWGVAFLLLSGLLFAPLLLQGLVDDLISGLRVVAFGGPYNRATPRLALEIIAGELMDPWTITLLVSLVLLWTVDLELRALARTWFLALVAAILYRAPHPVQHGYLANVLALISSIVLALPTARVASLRALARPVRALAVLLLCFEAMPQIPFYCLPLDSIRAIGSLARGVDPALPPPGCRYSWFWPGRCHYPWADYCRALDYLRRTTSPDTEIANVLRRPPFPSLNGPAGRLSPFRVESGIGWIWMIDMDLDEEFAEELERTPNSVVVWSPDEPRVDPRMNLARLRAVIRRCYRPEARFGSIEVWGRLSCGEEFARSGCLAADSRRIVPSVDIVGGGRGGGDQRSWIHRGDRRELRSQRCPVLRR